MEAFSDAVVAIIITIMVLELEVPHRAELTALRPLIPVFLSYGLSFLFLGIYWTNHHHMIYVTHEVNGTILWANLHLLFWLSLVPFVTGWMGQNHFAPVPTGIYGVILLLAAIAYLLLQHAILRQEGPDSTLAAAIGRDRKGKISPWIYAIAILVAFVRPRMAGVLYVVAALMWLLPDRRIERKVSRAGAEVSAAR
jgi:uncharacterized membrane protein